MNFFVNCQDLNKGQHQPRHKELQSLNHQEVIPKKGFLKAEKRKIYCNESSRWYFLRAFSNRLPPEFAPEYYAAVIFSLVSLIYEWSV